MDQIFLKGMGVGAGLIIAIGAQNTFVFAQGIKKEKFILIPIFCFFADALLIMVGVAGVGTMVARHEWLQMTAAVGGSMFLAWYGSCALRDFIHPTNSSLKGEANNDKNVLFTLFAFTFLNPHVYLDTIVLIGSISGQFEGNGRYIFGLGACLSSFLWFFLLSLCGVALSPLFKNPLTWRLLNLAVSLTMYYIAYSLIEGYL